jgi:C-terminal peptidase prc
MAVHRGRSLPSCRVVALFLLAAAGGPVPPAHAQDRPAAPPAGEKYALLVGVRVYDKNELRSLQFTDADMEDLAAVLKEQGYRPENVVVMTQRHGAEDSRFLPDAARIRKELRGLLRGRGPTDTVLVALSGHGVQFRGEAENFFCPADAKLSQPETLVSLAEVYRDLQASRAGFKFLLVDACRNDPQSDRSKSKDEVALESVTRPQQKAPPGGVAALFSCSAGEKSWEDPTLRHGVFFHFVIDGLKGAADEDRDGKVDLDELVHYARKRVPDHVRAEFGADVQQLPELVGKTTGPVVLAEGKGRRKAPPGKLDRPAAEAFAAKILEATRQVRARYVREVSQGDLVQFAVRGMFQRLEEPVPRDLAARLAEARDRSEPELTRLLTDARLLLGKRDELADHGDIDLALWQMLTPLDTISTYIAPRHVARNKAERGEAFGGVGLQVNKDKGGLLRVVTPFRGGPAFRAGVLSGDLITTITRRVGAEGEPLPRPEAVPTRGLPLAEAVKLLQGKPGTPVTVTVERDGADRPVEIELTRAQVSSESVVGRTRHADGSWDYWLDPERKIAYARVVLFARSTTGELDAALRDLDRQGLRGLVLDLRFNPGGFLTQATEVADLFIDDGLITTLRGKGGRETVYRGKSEGSRLNFPMVCLINDSSASGSEIIAACLQDHKRAAILGERSYGLASVHNLDPFDGGELKVLSGQSVRPSGKNISKAATSGADTDEWGVTPDPGLQIILTPQERTDLLAHLNARSVIPRKDRPAAPAAEFGDRQLDAALAHLRGQLKAADGP